MKRLTCLIFLMCSLFAKTQTSSLASSTYFRDVSLKPVWLSNQPFMPQVELKSIETIKQQNGEKKNKGLKNIKKHFFDQYLFEVHQNAVNLYFTPVVNFNFGQNWVENSAPRLFQNTRGIYVKKVFFNIF